MKVQKRKLKRFFPANRKEKVIGKDGHFKKNQ